MAKAALELIVSLQDQASAGLTRLQSALGGVAKALPGIAIGAAVVGGVSALGKLAWDAGQQFDEAFDTIQIRTGATGAELGTLKNDFRQVFASVPTDAGRAADVIAVLNSRLDASGPAVQALAKPLLEVSRLLGTDITSTAQNFTRVLGDWSVPTNEGAAALDKLFVAAQQSGVGIDQLMQRVVQFGSPLRLMGFSLDEATALFAKFEREGVNAELVMSALRVAAGKFAKDNVPLQEGLQRTMERIRSTTDASEALALGMKVFGARAGPDMVAAIREGRFAVDDLVAGMADAEGAILRTAEATADFPEKFQRLRNKLTVILAPLGLEMLDLLTRGVEWATPGIERFFDGIGRIRQAIQQFGLDSKMARTAFQMAFGEDLGGLLHSAATNAVTLAQRIGGVVAAIGEFGVRSPEARAALETLFGPTLGGLVATVAGAITTVVGKISAIGTAISEHGLDSPETFAALSNMIGPDMAQRVQDAATGLQNIGTAISEHGLDSPETFAALSNMIGPDAAQRVQDVATGLQTELSAGIRDITGLSDDWARAQNDVNRAMAWIDENMPQGLIGWNGEVGGLIGKLLKLHTTLDEGRRPWIGYTSITRENSGVLGDLIGVYERLTARLAEAPPNPFGPLKTAAESLRDAVRNLRVPFDALRTFLDGLMLPNPFGGLLSSLDGLIGKVGSALAGLRELLGLKGAAAGSPGDGAGGGGSGFATGTFFAPGGLTLVGERGPELLMLPRGSQVQSRAELLASDNGAWGDDGVAGAGTTVNRSDTVIIQDRAALALYLDQLRREQGVALATAW